MTEWRQAVSGNLPHGRMSRSGGLPRELLPMKVQGVAQHQSVARGAVAVIGRVQVLREQVARKAPANAKIRKAAGRPGRAWPDREELILNQGAVSELVRIKS